MGNLIINDNRIGGGLTMTIAELHGKLSPYEQVEDLLTSDVFSTFMW